ncbi:hypothetical protein SBRCBS47491_010207, partial [Sporothrix bragantina]
MLTLPDSTHDKLKSGFLIVPCLRAILSDLAPFSDSDTIQKLQICTDVSTVAAEVKEIVEAAVSKLRGEEESAEHDAVVEETQTTETLTRL